ncbi:PaaI family thioesterase [Parendozoicomonas haliclonae]|uniref:Putative thioesterase n=1 Tax=Parendozoicomonas haliclonae TaxID=1960125 RepID=A0A1X7AIM6_9GAMM|nr:YiiD C-terminal domain-containing protein [Parendozoicomonas haliclonae]SMA44045.1 putative thioesterase [Parendozoicomonas haliclonae]
MLTEMLKPFAEEKIAFVKRTGLQLVHAESGYVKCLMPEQGNENHIGTMYAGAMFTLAEIPGGIMCLSSFEQGRFFPLLKNMSVKFVKLAKGDITFETRLSAEEIAKVSEEAAREGKADFFLKGELLDGDGEVVAVSEGHYQIRAIGK